jgi:adenylate cyclase
MERKLAAIFSADVKGYSRLMGDDEIATVRTLTAYREVITTLIHAHRGRVVDSPGDNLLAEFASVVDAVQCATEIQQALAVRNAELPVHRQMAFRIGINVGDVLTEDNRLYGDGVNIAARVEGLADAGGICISEAAYAQVKNKLVLSYIDIGEQQVKNIAEPVRVYRVAIEVPSPLVGEGQGEEAVDGAVSQQAKDSARQKAKGKEQKSKVENRINSTHHVWQRVTLGGLLLIAVTFVAVRYLSLPTSTQSPPPNPQSAALPLPDKPSIVVLPFVNMSNDSEQEYFSDGITEDITTGLAKISSLFVIARNSAFTYKGKAVKVQNVSRELGVQYVLEGSVRRTGEQIRVTAQLIDGLTGSHLWAERFDRPLKEIFAVQDEIVQKIVTTLKLQLTLREQGILVRKRTENLEAYDSFLRGLESLNRTSQETNAQARQLFEQAIVLDPQYAEAYAGLSRTLSSEWAFQWSQDPQTLERAFVLAQKAVALDDSLPEAHKELAYTYLYKRQHEQAIAAAKRGIALGPNEAENTGQLGLILNFAGQPEEAVGLIQKAMRLNPRYPYNYLAWLGMAYRLAGRYDEAIAVLQSAAIRNPNFLPPHLHLAISYSEIGRDAEARAEVAELLRISPQFSLEGMKRVNAFKNPTEFERWITALRKAGLK